jgi:hypothetical protein
VDTQIERKKKRVGEKSRKDKHKRVSEVIQKKKHEESKRRDTGREKKIVSMRRYAGKTCRE